VTAPYTIKVKGYGDIEEPRLARAIATYMFAMELQRRLGMPVSDVRLMAPDGTRLLLNAAWDNLLFVMGFETPLDEVAPVKPNDPV